MVEKSLYLYALNWLKSNLPLIYLSSLFIWAAICVCFQKLAGSYIQKQSQKGSQSISVINVMHINFFLTGKTKI